VSREEEAEATSREVVNGKDDVDPQSGGSTRRHQVEDPVHEH